MADSAKQFNLADYFLDDRIREGHQDRLAVVVHEGDSYTYGQIQAGANRCARVLQNVGLEPEQRVLMVLPDSVEFVYTWFGVLKAGGVFAMVNPRLPSEDYSYYLSYTRARVLVTTREVADRIGPAIEESPWLKSVLVVDGEGSPHLDFHTTLSAEEPTFTNVATHRDDSAGWLFTSGSTGHPKAAVHRHHDFAWNTERYAKQVLGILPEDRTLSVAKLYFGYATGTNLMFPFAVGAATVLFSGAPKPPLLFDLIEQYAPTVITNVPTMIGKMLAQPDASERDLSSLRLCLSAGEALPAELYERWIERTGVEILDGIGSAEMFHIYISNYPGDVKLGSLGKLVPGYEARIVDEQGVDVPPGEIGTLWIKGESAAQGYWLDQEKSRATFAGDWCFTSDQFRQDENGYFIYCGRADDLLKVGGIFVSPIEVENCLLGHPDVEECCVLGFEEEGLMKAMACVVLRDGAAASDATAESLRAHTKAELAPYKTPREFKFLAEMPKNDRGKMDRKSLKAQWGGAR